ncbi:desmoglein-2-like [Thalassophryne amazonica]|uniref:desmoglein-2-like n=1 Tax=Thalassophryne amazonica TaxID=390379 RepID=UPI001471A1A4|nr:desmoglein-2-like [Thalassophryne amazonica]
MGLEVEEEDQSSGKKKPTKGKSYPVNIAVQNEPEGIAFKPKVKPVSVSENPDDNPIMKVIGGYTATDADTGQPADNVQYAKGNDPENWLLVDPNTAEIRLQKTPDRESPFLVNGTYYAQIVGIVQGSPSRTATGTIALQVGDENDNCPILKSKLEYVCSGTEQVIITAEDEDRDPNAAPFIFSIVPKQTTDKWKIEHLNDTKASLQPLSPLWPGMYRVTLIIQDQQGLACPDNQEMEIYACTCDEEETCRITGADGRTQFLKDRSATFGGLGACVLILAILPLILVGILLMTCSCGDKSRSFSDLPFDAKEYLIVYHTEGRGEDKDVPLLSSPAHMMSPALPAAQAGNVALGTQRYMEDSFTGLNLRTSYSTCNNISGSNRRIKEGHFGMLDEGLGTSREIHRATHSHAVNKQYLHYEGIALPDVYLHQYYSQKASCGAEQQPANDSVLEYDYEGQGSSAGSVGCCSILEFDDDLQFLNDLDPNFKTLAEICCPPTPLSTSTPVAPVTHATSESSVSHELDTVDQFALPSLGTKAHGVNSSKIHGNAFEHHHKVTQPSTSAIRVDRTSTNSIHQLSHSTNHVAKSPTICQITPPMLPSTGQICLLQQQPVYYTTSPVLQPLHCILQPPLQNAVLLTESPATNLQGMVVLNGGFGQVRQSRNTGGTLSLSRRRSSKRVSVGGEVTPERSHTDRVTQPPAQSFTLISGHIAVGAAGSENRLSQRVDVSEKCQK